MSINDVTAAIADHLPGWRYEQGVGYGPPLLVETDGPGRIEVSATKSGTQTRLQLVGTYPTDSGGWTDTPKDLSGNGDRLPALSVSASRPPRAIAREIVNRLLPPYRETLRLVLDIIQRNADAARARRSMAERLAAIAGGSYDHRDIVRIPGAQAGGAYGSVQCYEDDVAIQLRSVRPALAERIIRMVNEDNAGRLLS